MSDQDIRLMLREIMKYWASKFHSEYMFLYDDYSNEINETREIFDQYFENKLIIDTTNSNMQLIDISKNLPNIWITYDTSGKLII